MHHSNRCALTSCTAPLPSGKKYVAIELLTKEILYFVVNLKTKGQELFEQVCNYLCLNDSELFGLALYTGDEYQFIDPALKISKIAPKSWKVQHGYGVDDFGKPLLTLHFRIQYYVDCHLLINDKITRHIYYLQLLQNVINYSQSLSNERALLLSAYALQADFGNYNSDRHKDKYFDPKKYFPERIIQNLGEDYIIKHIPAMHKDNISLSRGEAQVMYIKEASDRTAPHNLHFYKMHRKKTKADSNVWLAICAKGIEIYEENNLGLKNKLSTFLWHDIAKLYFEKKKFEIRSVGCPEERKFTYYASTEDLAKSLLWLCRMTHQFHMITQTRVQELKQLELEGHKPYRESYIYSDSLDMAWEKRQRDQQDQPVLPCSVSRLKKINATSNSNEQRVSVISSTSSNTTSGIVSDRIQSFDESEDDLEIENLTPLSSHNLGVASIKNRQHGMENKDNTSQCSERSEHSSSVESGMGDQLSVPCSGYWNTDGKRTTPTSSLLSGGSYTSFTDSTHSSSSQLSAITVKANLISPRVGTLSHRNCCWNSCCSNIVNDDDSNSDNIQNFTKTDLKTSNAISECIFVEQHQNFKNNGNSKNGFNKKLSPQEIEILLEKQLHRRQRCIHNYMHNTLPPFSFSNEEISSASSSQTLPCDHVHVIGALCSKKNLEETTINRQKNLLANSHSPLYSSTPTISQQSQIFSQEPYIKCASSLKFQSLPLQSVIYPVASVSHIHGRNATKIGVSSLTRHRTPLSIFNNRVSMMTAASEPNLCCSKILPDQKYISSVNSKASSNNSLHEDNSSIQNLSHKTMGKLLNNSPYNSNPVQLENPSDVVGLCDNVNSIDLNNFPCIPPPLAYRTTNDKVINDMNLPRYCTDEIHSCHQNCVHRNIPLTYFSKSLESLPSFIDNKQLMSKDMNNSCYEERFNKLSRKYESIPSLFNSFPDSANSLDLHQLREKSKDLDLPLISALCNDRSLLMLPKTVPTCSRQRHIGTKDFRRFSCSYVNSLQSNYFKSITETVKSSFGSLDHPLNLHLESSDYLCLKNISQFSTRNKTFTNHNTNNSQPSFSSKFYNSYPFISTSHFDSAMQHSHTVFCQHPSAILTSFGTLSNDNHHNENNKNFYPQRQLIPTKLSMLAQSCSSNGILYAKEQAS